MNNTASSFEERFRLLIDAVEDYAIFILDPTGHVATWNAGAQKIKGYTASEIVGKHFSIFYTPEAIASGWPDEELRRAIRDGRFEDEGWRLRKGGSRFWANVVITRLSAPDGTLQGFAKITRDLSERKRHEEALRESEQRFRLLIENVKDHAIFMLSAEGMIESWNTGAQLITGYDASDIIGRHFSTLFPPDDAARGTPASLLQQAVERGRVHVEGWRMRKDSSLFWAEVVLNAVFDDEHRLRGFTKVTRDMTERRRLEDLETSSRRMTEFLAMLGHELRNPLAPIRNAVSIMQLEPLATPTLRGCRDMIDRQLSHLTRLVDDLLDIGRVTTGKITLQKELLSIGDVLVRSIEGSRVMLDSRGHHLDLDLPSQPVQVNGDLTRLAQVFQNLLNNAAKFTPHGGRIAVSVTTDGGLVIVHVRDNGMGITSDALPGIFNLFTQEASRIDPGVSGLGIGLTVARAIVEMHGGTIQASSEGVGMGSVFDVRLPLAASDATRTGVAPALRRATAERLRVLVVDDNRDAADSLALLVRMMGHDAREVYDGAGALELASEFQPDVALLDLAMPRIDGIELQTRLRTNLAAKRPIIAAVTGLGLSQNRKHALDAGFDEFIVKPVAVQTLVDLFATVPR